MNSDQQATNFIIIMWLDLLYGFENSSDDETDRKEDANP